METVRIILNESKIKMPYKKDLSHDYLVNVMLVAGATRLQWIDTSWSRGKLLDGILYNNLTGRVMFVEIKNEYPYALTDKEAQFISKHNMRHAIVYDEHSAENAARRIL